MGTHTYALMIVSAPTYHEVMQYMQNAGYDHAIHEGEGHQRPALDMHGIALTTDTHAHVPKADLLEGFYWVRCGIGGWVPAELDRDGVWHPAGITLDDETKVEEVGPMIVPHPNPMPARADTARLLGLLRWAKAHVPQGSEVHHALVDELDRAHAT